MNSLILKNPNNDPIIARLIENQLTIQRSKKNMNNLSGSSIKYNKICTKIKTKKKSKKNQKYK